MYTVDELAQTAFLELDGVGDAALGQWAEWTGRAFHLRRRLSLEEQQRVGEAIDCRGTAEWAKRYYDMAHKLPEAAKRLAQNEMLKSA